MSKKTSESNMMTGQKVYPEPVTEPSFLESVGEFLATKRRLSSGNLTPLEFSKKRIHVTWAKFEEWNYDISLEGDVSSKYTTYMSSSS